MISRVWIWRSSALLIGCAVWFNTAIADSAIIIPDEYKIAARKGGVPYPLLYAIALQESNNPNVERYSPWPWTLNVAGESFYLDNELQAVALFKQKLNDGVRNIDVCAGQVNYLWNGELIKSIEKAFSIDNCLEAATAVLVREFEHCEKHLKVVNWWCAVRRYHSPGSKPEQIDRARKYESRVKSIYTRVMNE